MKALLGYVLAERDNQRFIERRYKADYYINEPFEPLVIHHSPSGMNAWGYRGPGPSDLALNILEDTLQHKGWTGPRQQCFDGECFTLAWRLHQRFKEQFIARVHSDGAFITISAVRDFINGFLSAERKLV